MKAVLEGSSPGATTAAILLMSRARQLGYPLKVDIAGDPDAITPVFGPAVVHAPVLASCGVGRRLGHGGTVVIPGPDDAPLQVSLQTGGDSGWFEIHRAGPGIHPASQAFYRMSRDPRVEVKKLAKQVRVLFESLGVAPHTGLLDILFSAPVPTLTRIAIALRAGRSEHAGTSQPVTQFLSGTCSTAFDITSPSEPENAGAEHLLSQTAAGNGLDGLHDDAIASLMQWAKLNLQVAKDDGFRDGAFVEHMAELVTQLRQLPAHSILPPLDSTLDGVALGIPKALRAVGHEDANQSLRQMFTFLGGRYVESARQTFSVHEVDAPEAPQKRWQWFCQAALIGRDRADELWPLITDPPS